VSDRRDIDLWANPQAIATLAGVALVAGIAGALVARSLAPSGAAAPSQGRRPIVQIVRPQPGLPSLADTMSQLCPSIAFIAPGPAAANRSSQQGPAAEGAGGVPAFAVSVDGWLVTTASIKAAGRMHAQFGDGRSADVSKVRIDPVSGLAVAKVNAAGLAPLTLADQGFPRVGDFGFALQTPNGNGCSGEIAMVASDFLADGGGPVSYIRTQSTGPAPPPGAPFLNSDGEAVAVSIQDAAVPDAMIPAAIAGIVVDELIRGTPSPSIRFGFRATDFSPQLADRLSDARLRGAGVAIVQRGSPADKAGLYAGDVVAAVDDSPVSSASELGRALDAADKEATLQVIRGNSRLTIKIERAGPKR
jgi:S1-C subfamily serine protease